MVMDLDSLERQTKTASDGDLLRAYAERNSQAAFGTLVSRYVNFVYAACRREVRDPDLAQDVFLVLARKAASLRAEAALPVWLFKTARLASREALRKERRRMHYESQAARENERDAQAATQWSQIEPLLNDSLAALNAKEREVVLLRFFQGCSLRETGAALGLSEDAARMRVGRALDKMRRHLARAGMVVPAAALAALLLENSAQAAPASLVAALTHGPLSGAAPAALPASRSRDFAKGTLRAMKIMKLKLVALPVAGVVLTLSGLALAKNGGAFSRLAALSQAEGVRILPLQPNPEAGAASLPGTQLPDAFTLTYDVRERVTTSPQTLARMLESVRTGYALAVRQGKMTQAEADDGYKKSAKSLGNNPQRHHYLVTISARDGKLLDRCDNQEAGDEAVASSAIYLYDGQQSLQYYARNPVARIFTGRNLWGATDFPLPGLGIAGGPLLQNADTTAALAAKPGAEVTATGQVPSIHDVQGEQDTPNVIYRAGQVRFRMVNGKPQVLGMKALLGSRTMAQWDYAQHERFAGCWLASRFTQTELDNAGRGWRVMEYRLVKASEAPQEAAQFDINTWLPADTTVSFFQDHSKRKFVYDPNRGSWQGQTPDAPSED